MNKETKTVAVFCVVCGWEGRRHRTEMASWRGAAKCPDCKRWRCVFEAQKEIKIVDTFKSGKSRKQVARKVGVPVGAVDQTLRRKIKPGGS